MNFKTLSIIAASALIGVGSMSAQSTGAASTGTSSNGTSETAVPRGPGTPPTTAKMTQGAGPTSTPTPKMKRKHHRHSRRHMHHGHHAMKKMAPKPTAGAQ